MDRFTERRVERGIPYSPLPSQELFHNSTARFKGFSGPVGSGKSQALCQEAIRMSYLNPGRMGLIGAPTYPMLRDATVTDLMAVLRTADLPYEWNRSESFVVMKDTGSKILLRSLDEFERLRGTNLAWFGVDELTYTAEEAWLRLEGRLRDPKATKLCGFGVWTPKGYDWVYRRFIKDRIAGYDVVQAKPFENRYILDGVPDYYERLKSSYDPQFFQQEVLGAYLNRNAGLVYTSFDRNRNVRPVKNDPQMALYWALDFNVNPMSSVVVQRSGREFRVLDEIVLEHATTEEACEEFRSRYASAMTTLFVYGDASGQRRQTTGSSDYQIIREYLRRAGYRDVRYNVPPANPSVRDRVGLLNAKLWSALEEVEVVIDPRCKELIRDFEEVTYKPDSGVIDKERDSKRTHVSDALGYLIWQECRPQAPFGEQSRRLF